MLERIQETPGDRRTAPIAPDGALAPATGPAFDLNPLPMMFCDVRSRKFLAVNQAAIWQYGYSQHEFLSLTTDSLFAPGAANNWPASYGATPESPAEHIIRTVRHLKKGGDEFLADMRSTAIPFKTGEAVLIIVEDVTTRRQRRLELEAAWKLSEERFRLAAESSGDWIFEWNLTDDSLKSLGEKDHGRVDFGGELPTTGNSFFALIHERDRECVESTLRWSIKTGERFGAEFRIRLPSGEIRYWATQGAVLRNADETPSRWIGVCKDITAQKQVERANADLAAIVETADAAIIRRDLAGVVTSWNRGAETMYGYSRDEMRGQTFDILIAPQTVPEYALKEKSSRGEGVTHLEMRHRTKSGKLIDVLMTVFPVCDPDGMEAGTACVAWDITQIKQLEQQLAHAKKLESIGQLAAGIAHEINTPMQFIGDSVYFLRQSFEDVRRLLDAHAELCRAVESASRFEELTARIREIEETVDLPYLHENVPPAFERTLGGIDHVSSIVGAMKEFAHPQTDQKSPADINKALRNALTVSRNEYKYVADLETDFGPIPQVPCHIGELNQVFLNLIINAAHAIGDAVKGSDRRGKISVSTRPERDAVTVRIADTGVGIAPEIRGRIFDPFFTTKAIGKGTGQGLAISRSIIVDKHAGILAFESEVGQGTTFIIRLPLSEDDSSEGGVAI